MDPVRGKVAYEAVPLALVDPDPNNPRKEFADLAEMAAGFETNFVFPNEPLNPIVVVRVDGRFRLVDGERRWRAMRAAGKVGECHALVCEDAGAAEAVLAMIATDDKRGLSAEERDRGVQLALRLGVAPAKVDRAAKMKRGTAKRVLAGMRAAGEREFRQQSIEAYELSVAHAGDDEVLDFIASYEGPNLRIAVDGVLRRRGQEEAVRGVRGACEAAGVPCGARAPAGSPYIDSAISPDLSELPGIVADALAAGGVAYVEIPPDYWDIRSRGVALYGKPVPGAPADSANKVGRMHSAAKRRRAEWVSARLLDDGWEAAMPNVCALARAWMAETGPYWTAEFFRRAGIGAPEGFGGLCPFVVAQAWQSLDGLVTHEAAEIAGAGAAGSSNRSRASLDASAAGYDALLTALAGDGYVPDEHEERLWEACRGRFGRRGAGGD